MFPKFPKYSLYKETECIVGFNTLTTNNFDDNKIQNMSNKQTASEWLREQYYESEGKLTKQDFEQAKAMEKEQIIDAAERWKGTDFAERYYQETYVDKLGNEDVPKLGYDVKGSEFDTFKDDVREVVEDDVEKLAEEWFESKGYNIYNHYNTMPSFIEGYNKAKSTLYTEEQVREAMYKARNIRFVTYSDDEIVESLKQPKKD